MELLNICSATEVENTELVCIFFISFCYFCWALLTYLFFVASNLTNNFRMAICWTLNAPPIKSKQQVHLNEEQNEDKIDLYSRTRLKYRWDSFLDTIFKGIKQSLRFWMKYVHIIAYCVQFSNTVLILYGFVFSWAFPFTLK